MAPSGKRVAPEDTSSAATKKTKTDCSNPRSGSFGVILKKKMKPPMKEEKSDTRLTDMPWEMQAQIFEHLPVDSLYKLMLTNQVFFDEAIYALRKKDKRNGLGYVFAKYDGPIDFSLAHVKDGYAGYGYYNTYEWGGDHTILLDTKSPYFGDEITKFLYILLTFNHVSQATLTLDLDLSASKRRGYPLPFEKYFLPASDICNKIRIESLTTSNPELASLLRFVCPEKLFIEFRCDWLFDENRIITILGVQFLTLKSYFMVDTVDAVMEQCDAFDIKLKGNCFWSDESIKRVLTANANSNTSSYQTITCNVYNVDEANEYKRTRAQWKELFAAWQSSYTRAHPNFHRARRIRMRFLPYKETMKATQHADEFRIKTVMFHLI